MVFIAFFRTKVDSFLPIAMGRQNRRAAQIRVNCRTLIFVGQKLGFRIRLVEAMLFHQNYVEFGITMDMRFDRICATVISAPGIHVVAQRKFELPP